MALAIGAPLVACGPWFPNRLLSDAGAGVLWAPAANFKRELVAMKLATSRHQASIPTNSHPAEAATAETNELRAALVAAGRSGAEVDRILAAHGAERAALQSAVEAAMTAPTWPGTGNGAGASNSPAITPGSIRVANGLPGEFDDYFRGALAWHGGLTNDAVRHWEALLRRPAEQRRYRSTWAAFMLGKALSATEPKRAIAAFQHVRALAREEFADSIGLAASSLGWEARLEFRRGRFERAIELYLKQEATGDETAELSLRFTAETALRKQARSLTTLARDPKAQKVITAYLISGGWSDPPVDIDHPVREAAIGVLQKQSWIAAPTNGWHKLDTPVRLWLEAIEDADLRDVESSEKLALAAYQAGEFGLARRWLDRASRQPAAQWLRAKLLLRDGRIDEAASILATLVRQFPVGSSDATNDPASTILLERLFMPDRFETWDAAHQLVGEWGAVRLTRREYVEALDALLRARYWDDAAYVADRVLTVDELKTYVDRVWAPPPPDPTPATDSNYLPNQTTTPRDWLAWRLVRARRLAEALAYLKPADRPALNAYLAGEAAARDPRRPASERAAVLWDAAERVVASQLNVFTAPFETDWTISGGFAVRDTRPERLLPPTDRTVLPITPDERRRALSTSAGVKGEWYYRFIAADLAWEAGLLMPDQSETTAHVLWQAGTWIKHIDPSAADRFYKALVRRCGRTSLGAEAERKRWFPSEEVAGRLGGKKR